MSTAHVAPAATPLTIRTVPLPIDSVSSLLSLLPDEGALAWVRDGEGLVGWGEAARVSVSGAERFSRAQRWWTSFCAEAVVDDRVRVAGSGPVAFASFAFDPSPGTSVLVVPSVVVGLRDGRAWLTVVSTSSDPSSTSDSVDAGELLRAASAVRTPVGLRYAEGSVEVTTWLGAVDEATRRIEAGELDKVVLARDIVAHLDEPLDVRHVLARLSSAYPECWTFCVDGMVGATPELLVRRSGESVMSRVLAGTVRRSSDAGSDAELATSLLESAKDHEEHAYAVASVAAALAAHCTDLSVPPSPRLLALANVQHLATDVTGSLADGATVLGLAASLHPTAAVCGTPTERAFALIRSLEGMSRGRYAGPVGWLSADGDGELGIALRCGAVADDGLSVRLFAGCGIVAASSPEAELAESQAKLVPMRDALESS
jgi:menaquinone-specific isochorismate synthase